MHNKIGFIILFLLVIAVLLVSCDKGAPVADLGTSPEAQTPGTTPGEENGSGTSEGETGNEEGNGNEVSGEDNKEPEVKPNPNPNPTPNPEVEPETKPDPNPEPTPNPEVDPDTDPEPTPDPGADPNAPPEPTPSPVYTVKFELGYEGLFNTVQTEGVLVAPPNPIRTGYNFLGWFYENTLWSFENIISSDISLTAKWDVITYKIDYVIPDGENNPSNPDFYTLDNTTLVLSDPLNYQGVFDGWYLDKEFTVPFEIKVPYSDITAYAKFTVLSGTLEFEKIGETYYVSGYSGNEDVITIPDTYLGLSVTGIRANAFSEAVASKIILPKSLKYIEKDAFSSAQNLKFSEHGETKYLGTADNPFFALISVADGENLESIEIKNECVIVADYAFFGQGGLSLVIGGDNVKFVGNSAFKNARFLKEIDIFDTVAEIGENAFYCCTKLTEIKFGESLISIGNSAFAFCEALRFLSFAPGIAEIPERAFESCLSLEEIIIDDSVERIGLNAFRFIPDTAKIYFKGSESQWNEIELNSNFILNQDFIFFDYVTND